MTVIIMGQAILGGQSDGHTTPGECIPPCGLLSYKSHMHVKNAKVANTRLLSVGFRS